MVAGSAVIGFGTDGSDIPVCWYVARSGPKSNWAFSPTDISFIPGEDPKFN